MEEIETVSKERLAHLEDKIFRVSALFNHMLKRNHQLEEEIRKANGRARSLEERCRDLQSIVDEVRRERDAVLKELAGIQEELAGLER